MMVCEPRASVEVLHVAMPVEAATACAEQPGMAALVTLSVKATEPVRGTPPDGKVSVAVKVTDAFTAELGCEETTARLVAPLFTVSVGESEAVLPPKFESWA